jgi:hypothetical protein
MALPDVSSRFTFRNWMQTGYFHRFGERPLVRRVQWTETASRGKKEAAQTLGSGNFGSPQWRETSGLAPGLVTGLVTDKGKGAAVIPLFGPRR